MGALRTRSPLPGRCLALYNYAGWIFDQSASIDAQRGTIARI